jgi:L-ascorbate metabolism protein UlaG (beta-lactamase superfamily)
VRAAPLMLLPLLACAEAPAPPAAPAPAPVPPPPPKRAELVDGAVVLETEKGPLVVTPVYHGTARVSVGGKTVWIDPWSKAALDGAPKADVVLLTDTHFDHLDRDALAKVVQEGTVFVAPQAAVEPLAPIAVQHVLANGASAELGDLRVEAVPMYNLVRGPEEGGVFHDKGRGNGYVLHFGGKRVYFAGDTECTEEMKALQGIDLAFLPMNLPYTMTPEEAAACADAFAPAVVVPYHYAGSELAAFQAGVKSPAVKVLVAEFYPGGLPW